MSIRIFGNNCDCMLRSKCDCILWICIEYRFVDFLNLVIRFFFAFNAIDKEINVRALVGYIVIVISLSMRSYLDM